MIIVHTITHTASSVLADPSKYAIALLVAGLLGWLIPATLDRLAWWVGRKARNARAAYWYGVHCTIANARQAKRNASE